MEERKHLLMRGNFLLVAILWAVALSLVLSGCVSTGPQKPTAVKQEKKELVLMWPEPPLTPRIKFVRTLSSSDDFKTKTSWAEKMMEFVGGKVPPKTHLYKPMAVAATPDGKRIYVSDNGQDRVYIFDMEKEKVSILGGDKVFMRPFGVALDTDENLYVVEQGTATIYVFARDGKLLKAIKDPEMVRPTGIAVDSQRKRIYVADPATQGSMDHYVRVFDLEGNPIMNIGKGRGPHKGELYFPTYVALDKDGNIYVTDTMNARVSAFDADGNFFKNFGERGDAYGMFEKPKGVALDTFGNIYVVDSSWSVVQIFNQKGQPLLFFGGRQSYPGMLKNPTGIAIDGNNTIYVADMLNYRVDVYQLVNTKAEDSFIKIPEEKKSNGTDKAAMKK